MPSAGEKPMSRTPETTKGLSMRAQTNSGSRRPAAPPPESAVASEPTPATKILDRYELLSALSRLKKGDFTVRLDDGFSGVDEKIADAFNHVVELNKRMSVELARLSQVVGKEGRISERASLG